MMEKKIQGRFKGQALRVQGTGPSGKCDKLKRMVGFLIN
jgi:hypothetical protein